MAGDRRAEYLKKWFHKAKIEEDVVDRFICGWLALAIAAQIHRTYSEIYIPKDTDRLRVIDYLKDKANSVEGATQTNKRDMEALANRNGTDGGIVVDGIQRFCRRFRGKVLGRLTCSPEEFGEAVAEILNKVRNNLFHGSKMYDDANDRALLELVTPLLLTIVAKAERLELV